MDLRGGWGELSGKLLRLPSLFAAVCLFALDFKWLSMSSLLTWREGERRAGQLALPNINACKAAMRSKVNKSNNNYKEQGGQLLKKKVKQLVSIRLLDEWQPRRLSAETDSQTRDRQTDGQAEGQAGRQLKRQLERQLKRQTARQLESCWCSPRSTFGQIDLAE